MIIPVYGVEKYIERCARSLFEQTLDDIEYLFIDDCTPDRSIQVLKNVLMEYPERKAQVIIHCMEQNSGQAKVREWGIKNATGEFVIHCDSDDWVDKEMYQTMYSRAIERRADIVICDFMFNNGLNEYYQKTVSARVKTIEDYKVGVITRDVHCNLWNKLIKKELFENELIFPKDNYGEDSALIIQYFYYANSIVYIPQPFYHYCYNLNSISKKQDIDSLLRAFYQTCNNVIVVDKFYKGKSKNIRIDNAIQYLKCMERDRILKLTSQTKYYNMWINAFPEINMKLLLNQIVPYKIKIRYIIGLLRLYPILDKWFH